MPTKIAPSAPCPCNSSQPYKACCAPYHKGQPAPTPEALMRSRYSAYAVGDVDYIMATTHPDNGGYMADKAAWRKQLRAYVNATDFLGLLVHERNTDADGERGTVRFSAALAQNGLPAPFSETSVFVRVKGRWLYRSGKVSR